MDSKHALAFPAHKIRGRNCFFPRSPTFLPESRACKHNYGSDSQALLPSSIEHQLCCCSCREQGRNGPAAAAVKVIRYVSGRTVTFHFSRFWTPKMFVLSPSSSQSQATLHCGLGTKYFVIWWLARCTFLPSRDFFPSFPPSFLPSLLDPPIT